MGRKRLQERLLWLFLSVITFSPLFTILIFSNNQVFSDGKNDFSFDAVNPKEIETPAKASVGAITTSYKGADNVIEILGRTIKIVTTNTTSVTPNNEVAQYYGFLPSMEGRFFFGHNSSNVFAGLANLRIGSTFRVIRNGVAKTYQVKKVVTVPNDNNLLRDMYDIAQAKYQGVNYSVSLMTCAGTSYGNGNATHRTLVFANQI